MDMNSTFFKWKHETPLMWGKWVLEVVLMDG